MNLVTNKAKIDSGFPLSKNFLLEHLTTGAFHNVMGKWIPQFPLKLLPWHSNGIFSDNFPLLQLVQNLQVGSQSILDNLLPVIGQMLEIRAGALSNSPLANINVNEALHTTGAALDIAVSGYRDNHYHIAKDIRSLCRRAESINMVYGSNSYWFHLEIDKRKAFDTSGLIELPRIRSIDLLTGETIDGIQAMRGYV